ncbi:helix-turn-helix domain-containing protein [Chryseobacterium sp. StRB126]|uniref:helix-turn-helix domain-containing protein n=1 Tax=Chryseobacterium sp. StRB126 TaxID=878220 RepID=UPI0005EE7C18|nr:AraC family transcriptional regulator [Chryseobacterium sp. StRB126]
MKIVQYGICIEMEKAIEINNLPEYIKKSGGLTDKNGYLNFPESLGTGYLKMIAPLPQLSIMLQHYELKKSLFIKRSKHNDSKSVLIFSFRNVITGKQNTQKKSSFKFMPSVQVSTADVALDIEVPNLFETSNIIIRIEANFLRQLLEKDNNARLTELVIQKEQSYLYEEFISPKIQSVAADIFEIAASHPLANFYYKIKAEELIYLFFENLLQRDELPKYSIHPKDIKAVYRLREEMLDNINEPPQLDILATKANMSVSKLGKIFKQIFGDSIYNYYQKLRMQKAAFLLREEKLSVSEVGYQFGFSNLSHFSRLFEKHIGMKPKKYSKIN